MYEMSSELAQEMDRFAELKKHQTMVDEGRYTVYTVVVVVAVAVLCEEMLIALSCCNRRRGVETGHS